MTPMGWPFALVALGRDVALATLDVELHAQVALRRQRADVEVGVDDLHVGRRLDVRRAHLGRPLDVEQQRDGVLGEALQAQVLEVEDHLGHVLLDVRDRRELVGDAVDLDRRHRGAPQRRQQHAAKRVAERGPKPRVQGLDVELPVVRARLELADLWGHSHLGVNCQLGYLPPTTLNRTRRSTVPRPRAPSRGAPAGRGSWRTSRPC